MGFPALVDLEVVLEGPRGCRLWGVGVGGAGSSAGWWLGGVVGGWGVEGTSGRG